MHNAPTPPRASLFGKASTVFIIAILLCLHGNARMASAALAPTNTLTFSEAYSERVVCTRNPVACVEVDGDSFVISAKILLAGADIATFTPATAFQLTLGGLQITNRLGDDPLYVVGKKAAKFATITRDAANRVILSRTVRLKWTATLLTVTIVGRTTDITTPGWASILANTFAGRASGPLTDTINGSASFAGLNVVFGTLPVTGSVVTRNVTGRDGMPFTLSKVNIRATGKGVRPTIMGVQVTMGTDTPVTNMMFNNSGGTVTISSGSLAGTTIMVPPGALAGQTIMMLSQNDASLTPRSGTFSGRALSIHTDGQTTFEEPLQITIPFPNDGNTIPVPYFVETNGTLQPCQVISIDSVAGTMTFETFHASLFTWLWALFTGEGGHTTYLPAVDGFQIVNLGSVYNPGGECFGISAFEQWFFNTKGGGLYPKYMQNISVPGGGTVKGQNIIATRAHTSVSRLWTTYAPRVAQQNNLTAAQRYASIVNILDNTARPTILYLSANPNSSGTHAVLAYDHNDNNTLAINDPNFPGQIRNAQLSGGSFTYSPYQSITVIGNGSLRMESFENIYQDAQSGFSGNGAAQVNVTSHTAGEHVSDRTIYFAGQIQSGQVLVDKLEVWLNGATKFEQAITPDGFFSVPISLVTGENRMTFLTKGHDLNNNAINAPNTQRTPFVIFYDSTNSVILITLTWNSDGTDLDLYTIDPTYPDPGGFSAYYHKTTADGGELDFDDTDGFGPEHWTLTANDTIRWGQEYDVRVHYYSDNSGSSSTTSTRWTASVLLYEGTSRAVNYTFTGVLSSENASNDDELDGGADWSNVCTIVPVQAAPGMAVPSIDKSSSGKRRITVPVLPKEERLFLKAFGANARR